MKLLKLQLTNFKGIRDFAIDPEGRDVDIFGQNGTGKTTVVDAVNWLLFGKDLMDRSENNFGIKTKVNGEVLHNLDHSVTAIFDVDGKETEFTRTYAEIWTKKRGSATSEFSGHTTDYFINKIPMKAKEYQDYINNIIDEKLFKLLTNPLYFNDILSIADRRKILIDLVGDISAEEITKSQNLDRLSELMTNLTLDEIRLITKSKMKSINDQLKSIPERIDELTRTLTNDTYISREKEKRDTEKLIEDKRQEMANIKNGTEIKNIEQKLKELGFKKSDIQYSFLEEENDRIKADAGRLREMQNKLQDISNKKSLLKNEVLIKSQSAAMAKMEMEKALREIANLRVDYADENKRPADIEIEIVCHACGQDIPMDKIEQTRDNLIADFNIKKSNTLEGIKKEASLKKKQADDLKIKIDELEKDAEKIKKEIDIIETEINAIMDQIEVAGSKTHIDKEGYKNKTEYKDILKQEETLYAAINGLRIDIDGKLAEIGAEIEKLSELLREINQYEAEEAAKTKTKERIIELEKQEKQLAKEYEQQQAILFETEQFTKAQVNLLTEKIDSRFKIAKFKMFETAINGGIKETCVATGENGIAWNEAMNTGQKINIGIDIINTLCEYYGFSATIIIDNAESITQIQETSSQIIKLVHDPKQKKLKAEIRG